MAESETADAFGEPKELGSTQKGQKDLSQESGLGSSEGKRKPIAWPIFLALLMPLSLVGALLWLWSKDDYTLLLRMAWVSLCSVVPGISVVTILGGIVQLRKRPFSSLLSIFLSGCYLFGSWWVYRWIMANGEKFF